MRVALAVTTGVAMWLLYIAYVLPVVQWVNGHDPLLFQSVALMLSVCALCFAVKKRLSERRRYASS